MVGDHAESLTVAIQSGLLCLIFYSLISYEEGDPYKSGSKTMAKQAVQRLRDMNQKVSGELQYIRRDRGNPPSRVEKSISNETDAKPRQKRWQCIKRGCLKRSYHVSKKRISRVSASVRFDILRAQTFNNR